jgi:two-component system, OmpR family, KDP operon response regulator KdpE
MHDRGRDPEARIIYVILVVAMAPFVAAPIVRREPIGAGTSLCAVLAALGIIGLVVDWARRTRLPRARARMREPEPAIEPEPERAAEPAPAAKSKPDSVAEAKLEREREPPSAPSLQGPATVLIVEDEPAIRALVAAALAPRGLGVIEATTLAEGKRAIDTTTPAAILLDLGLPDGDGMHLLHALHAREAPAVIVLSARDRADDRVAALEAGADDYLLKPFDTRELLARLDAVLRRPRAPAHDAVLVAGPIRIDQAGGQATVEGNTVELTPIELRLLIALARQAEKVVTYRQLIEAVWGSGSTLPVHELRGHVAVLRRKIEADPARPRWLVAETGVGYRLRNV